MWVSGKAHPFADELDLGLVAPRGRGRHVDGPCATALHRCLAQAGVEEEQEWAHSVWATFQSYA